MKLVLGLVGEKGSGKETFAQLFKEIASGKNVTHVRFSDLLKETLTFWDIPTTRENLQKLAVVMKDGFGQDTLSHAIYQKLIGLEVEIILVDGVRWEADEKLIRKFENNLMVYITADLMLRYERLKQRKEKTNEQDLSFEQFMKEEKAENELIIPAIGKRADVKLENNGTIEEFKQKISEIYNSRILKISY